MVKDNLTFPGIGTHHPYNLPVKVDRRQCWRTVTVGKGIWGTNIHSDLLTQESDSWEPFWLGEKHLRCVCSPCPAVV